MKLRPVRSRWADDVGSLPFALLLIMVGVTLSALMAPIAMNQIRSTRENMERIHALHAAQAGLDVALGHLRAAHDGAGKGDPARLPCGLLTGVVGPAGTARYEVTIAYYPSDPQGKPDAWLTGNRLVCTPGAGTLIPPAFALIRAVGTDEATGAIATVDRRSLQGTYTFRTTNANIAGGLIHVYKTATSLDLCMDAGSGTPAAGTSLRMQPCSPGSLNQRFAYNPNLTIALTASRTPSDPLGMCLDAGTPHATGAVVRLQPCAPTTNPQQQWSHSNAANFQGTSNGIDLNAYCFAVQSPDTAGSYVSLTTSCGMPYNNVHTFSPEASVGAGAAGAPAGAGGAGAPVGQFVNFAQFGRCLDATEGKPEKEFMIAWPCKQSPDPTKVSWNQKFASPAIDGATKRGTGAIYTGLNGVTHCLSSPNSTARLTYVRLEPCLPSAPQANTVWTVHADTGQYDTSYIIVDRNGYCLTPTDPDEPTPDLYESGNDVSKIKVAECDGSTLQKWNASPNIQQALPLKDLGEK